MGVATDNIAREMYLLKPMRMIVRFILLIIVVIVSQWNVFYRIDIALLSFEGPQCQQSEKHEEDEQRYHRVNTYSCYTF